MKKLREVILDESPADYSRRIAENKAGELRTDRDADESVRGLMGPSAPIRRGGGARKRFRSKEKRGTKICPMCNIELTKCNHRPLPGRPKNTEPTAPAKAYIPPHLIEFLDDSGLRLGDVLEAVLESSAVRCWKKHVSSMGQARTITVVSSDGDEREEQYTALQREEERRSRRFGISAWARSDEFRSGHSANLDFLAQLAPTASKRCDRLVPVRLLQTADRVGRANRGDSFRYGRYSRSRFLAWAIEFYANCAMIHRVTSPGFVIGKTQVHTSRAELGAVKAIAMTGCPWCAGVIDAQPIGLRKSARREMDV